MAYSDDFRQAKARSSACCAFLCGDLGISTEPCNPGFVGSAKICCCSGGGKADCDVCTEKGMIGIFQKTCCLVQVLSLKHCSVGCFDNFFCGPGPLGENRPVVDMDIDFMNS